MNSYECNVCQHIYSPAEGDPTNGVVAGTPFEELPAEWVCPVCGVAQSSFHEMVEEGVC